MDLDPMKKKFKTEDYKKDAVPTNQREWTEFHKQKREENRKRKEAKLIKQYEKEKWLKEQEAAREKQEEEELKQQALLGRHYTLSIAVPGSILDNAQSPELRTYLAGQVARAAVIFNVDEIVVFDETNTLTSDRIGTDQKHACLQMARILQYLECPQYLRKTLFPQHRDLQYAGLLNPLDCPHHMRVDDESLYREGVVLDKPVKDGKGSYANVGLRKEVQLSQKLEPGVRVTVKLDPHTGTKLRKGRAVKPSTPCEERGLYWGYQVRIAKSLGTVFTECPYPDGYDLTVGTSERGELVDTSELHYFRHGLVVFGGVRGLEAGLDADESLEEDDPSLLFQHYLNTCPTQGTRTIRTEEAILITLSALRPKIAQAHAPKS